MDIRRLQDFADAASRLCGLLERPQRRDAWIRDVVESLASVYAMAA